MIAEGFYDLILSAEDIAREAKCGQFVHIACTGKTLRRPISICEINQAEGTIRLVYEIRGEGTRWLSGCKAGELLDILGPLGNGFTVPSTAKYPVFVGGGLGVPPLLEAAKGSAEKSTVLLGFRSRQVMILQQDFERIGAEVQLATDDGSAGYHGLVTDLLQQKIDQKKCDYIAACGPVPMLRAVAQAAEKAGISCEISLEERMGCGVGACLVCACKIRRSGQEEYLRVCKDGPVFDAKESVF